MKLLALFSSLSFLIIGTTGAIYKVYEHGNCTGQEWERNVYVGTCAVPNDVGFSSMRLVSEGDCTPVKVFNHGWCAGIHKAKFRGKDTDCLGNFGFTARAIMCNI